MAFPLFGVFEVHVDSQIVAVVDSYRARTAFMTTDVFGLMPGKHTLEIVNTGRKNAASGGYIIALDAVEIYQGPTSTPTASSSPTPTATFTPSPVVVQNIKLISGPPTIKPTNTPIPPALVAASLVIAYDENGNNAIDLAEGVNGISVRLVKITTNEILASGFTNSDGFIRLQTMSDAPIRLVVPEVVEEQNRPKKPPIALMGMAGVVFVGMLLFILPHLGGRGQQAGVTTVTATATLTVTPVKSPTPTPIALEQQDSVIQGGDSGRTVAFPVNLRVTLAGASQPRVFVVQRRIIQTAEWNFDSNPDTASYIAGLTVRPVIGVPYSPENAALFQSIADGTTFTLQMNTGAALRFTFEQRLVVGRSDTALFRQIGPGLVLALIGEHGTDGAPTTTRIVITATYLPDQELARDGVLTGLLPTIEPSLTPTPMPTVPSLSQVDVQIVSVETIPGHIITRLRIFNGQLDPVRLAPDSIWLTLGYAPEPDGPRVSADGLTAFDLLSGQAADLTLRWTWESESYASLRIGEYQYALQLR